MDSLANILYAEKKTTIRGLHAGPQNLHRIHIVYCPPPWSTRPHIGTWLRWLENTTLCRYSSSWVPMWHNALRQLPFRDDNSMGVRWHSAAEAKSGRGPILALSGPSDYTRTTREKGFGDGNKKREPKLAAGLCCIPPQILLPAIIILFGYSY